MAELKQPVVASTGQHQTPPCTLTTSRQHRLPPLPSSSDPSRRLSLVVHSNIVGANGGVNGVGGDDRNDSPPPGLAGVEGPQSECNGWQGSPPARCPCRRTV